MSDVVRWRLTEPRRGWARWTWTAPAPYLRPTIPPELAEIPGVKVAEISPLEGYVEAHESVTRSGGVFLAWWDTLPAGLCMHTHAADVVDVVPLRALFPHQAEAVSIARFSTNGILLADEMGLGKGVTYGTPVLTPSGWRAVESLRVNDVVVDPDGGAALVEGVYPQPEQAVYDVVFSDGASLRVDAAHLWHVYSPNDRKRRDPGRVLSTADLLAQPLRGARSAQGWTNRRWFVPVTQAVEFHPVPGDTRWAPYALGALIGDGHFSPNGSAIFTKPDEAVIARLGALVTLSAHALGKRTCPSFGVREAGPVLRALGLVGRRSWEKFIPPHYLRAAIADRIELLRGLMDTDGDCAKGGTATFNTSAPQLCADVVELVRSLGGIATVSTKLAPKYTYRGQTRVGRQAWRVNVRVPFNPFHTPQKASRWRAPYLARGIESITPAGVAPTICIRVASKRQLFVAGPHVVTHNTTPAALVARQRAGADGVVLIVAPKYVRSTWRNELTALGLLRDERDFLALESLDSSNLDAQMRDARWWFCHWDVLEAWASRVTFNLTGRKPAAVIFDEAHHARNPKTKRGSAMARVAGSIPFRMVLTGTPQVTRPSDLWNLLSAVDGPGAWGTNFAFRVRYCGAFQTDHGFKDGAPTHTDEFQARLKGRYLARTKAEVGLSLPPLLRSVIDVEKGAGFDDELKGLMRHYHVSAEDIVEALRDGGGVGELVLKALHALRRHTSEAKRKATLELLGDIVEARQSALVFVQERATAEQLSFELSRTLSYTAGRAKVMYLHGGCSDTDREDTIAEFQCGLADGRPRVLFATYGALREGVTLTAASHVVLHDLDWTPAVIFQAEARAHRLGLRHSVTSHWMTLADSIDTLFAAALLRKAREQRELLAASSSADALEDLGLAETAGAVSVEDDARRLISSWGGVLW